MKKKYFLTLFILTHIGFLFLQIHTHMQFIQYSFAKQKQERILTDLDQKKQSLVNEYYALQTRSDIKQYAEKNLNLKPTKLTQLKRLTP